MMRFLQRYSVKLSFALALLVGLQLPNFLQQYEHRLDAHYLEVQTQLMQYQALADEYFEGDLNALINKHERSDVLLFKKEATLIENLVQRFTLLKTKKQALSGTLPTRLLFLVGEFDQPLFLETTHNYTANIVLDRDAIIVGLVVALMVSLLVDCFFSLIIYLGKSLLSRFFSKKITVYQRKE